MRLRIDAKLHRRLRLAAADVGLSPSAWVNRLLEQALPEVPAPPAEREEVAHVEAR